VNDASDWTFSSSEGINDAGQIIGYGRKNGVTRAFLLTPVPEPDSMALFAASLLILTGVVRRTRRRAWSFGSAGCRSRVQACRTVCDETQHQSVARVTVCPVPAGWYWSVAHVDGTTVELGMLEQMTAEVRSCRSRLDVPAS